MNDDIYAHRLAWFKQNEKPEAVLLVAHNAELITIIVAWTSLEVGCTEKLTQLGGESENEIWEWLWKNARYSKVELIGKTGISFSESGLEIG